jgi:hypothetical protein
MEVRLKLSKQSTQSLVDDTTYRSIVRSLSHFLEEPQEDHLTVVKKILRYVADTCNWGLWFGRKKGNQSLLTGFSDADFAGDVDARKSTTWIIFFLANNSIV